MNASRLPWFEFGASVNLGHRKYYRHKNTDVKYCAKFGLIRSEKWLLDGTISHDFIWRKLKIRDYITAMNLICTHKRVSCKNSQIQIFFVQMLSSSIWSNWFSFEIITKNQVPKTGCCSVISDSYDMTTLLLNVICMISMMYHIPVTTELSRMAFLQWS